MDYNELAKQRNEQNHFARYIGIVTTKIEKGYAEAVLTVKPEHMNAMNIVHGGCIYTLADVATGSAAASLCSQAVTTSGEYHYLYSAKNSLFFALFLHFSTNENRIQYRVNYRIYSIFSLTEDSRSS